MDNIKVFKKLIPSLKVFSIDTENWILVGDRITKIQTYDLCPQVVHTED